MSKASSPAAAAADAAPIAVRSQPPDAVHAAGDMSALGGPASSAGNRLPSRLQRSPVAERTLSRLNQS